MRGKDRDAHLVGIGRLRNYSYGEWAVGIFSIKCGKRA